MADRAARREQVGVEFKEREADKLVNEFFDIEIQDRNGNGLTWGDGDDEKAFFRALEEQEGKIKELDPSIWKALRDPQRWFDDPDVIKAEGRYQKALDAYKKDRDTPKDKGLTVEEAS